LSSFVPYRILIDSNSDWIPKSIQHVKLPLEDKLSGHLCGVVILNDNWVATAARCLTRAEDMETREFNTSGSQQIDIDAVMKTMGVGRGLNLQSINDIGRSPLTEVHLHPEYGFDGNSFFNDIALLRVERSFQIGSSNVPSAACLASQSTETDWKKPLRMIGWGAAIPSIYENDSLVSTSLPFNHAKQMLMQDISSSDSKCTERPDLVCARPIDPADSPCHGDEGGPLMFQLEGKLN
jgi:secreted trypsin-like serine protease